MNRLRSIVISTPVRLGGRFSHVRTNRRSGEIHCTIQETNSRLRSALAINCGGCIFEFFNRIAGLGLSMTEFDSKPYAASRLNSEWDVVPPFGETLYCDCRRSLISTRHRWVIAVRVSKDANPNRKYHPSSIRLSGATNTTAPKHSGSKEDAGSETPFRRGRVATRSTSTALKSRSRFLALQ